MNEKIKEYLKVRDMVQIDESLIYITEDKLAVQMVIVEDKAEGKKGVTIPLTKLVGLMEYSTYGEEKDEDVMVGYSGKYLPIVVVEFLDGWIMWSLALPHPIEKEEMILNLNNCIKKIKK